MNRSYSKKRHINLVNEALEQAYLEKNSNIKYDSKNSLTENYNRTLLLEYNVKEWCAKTSYNLGAEGVDYTLKAGSCFKPKADSGPTAWAYCSSSPWSSADPLVFDCDKGTNRSWLWEPQGAGNFWDYELNWRKNMRKLYWNNQLEADLKAHFCTPKAKYADFAAKIANLGTFAGTTWKKEMAATKGYVYAGNMIIYPNKIAYNSADNVRQSVTTTGDWSNPSTVKVQGGMSAEDFINKYKNWSTNTGGGTNTGSGGTNTGSGWDTTCDGESKPFKKGCKSETIKKVQGCLGYTGKLLDGKFGSGTEGRVQAKIGKTSFTNADIDKLCGSTSTNSGGGGTPALTTVTTTEKQVDTPLNQF